MIACRAAAACEWLVHGCSFLTRFGHGGGSTPGCGFRPLAWAVDKNNTDIDVYRHIHTIRNIHMNESFIGFIEVCRGRGVSALCACVYVCVCVCVCVCVVQCHKE